MTSRDNLTRFYLVARRGGDDLQQALRYAISRSTRALLDSWRTSRSKRRR